MPHPPYRPIRLRPRRAPFFGPKWPGGYHGRRHWLRWFLVTGFLLAVFGIIWFVAAVAWYSQDLPDPGKLISRAIGQSTKIYDRTGQTVLYEVHGDRRRTVIPLADVPASVKWATIAIEDAQFYQHRGFSWRGIARAILVNVLRGRAAQGGSTLTQQLVKNAILSQEKQLSRKLKEAILTYQIERKFAKDEILQLYLNEIPYGAGAYGIESASQVYFSKSARDLTLAEAATLASLPKAPSYYSPYGQRLDQLLARKDFALQRMRELGYITVEEQAAAGQQPISFKPRRDGIIAPHFALYVREQLVAAYGERLVESGGLRVITSLDLAKQRLAEEVIAARAPGNEEKYQAGNAGLVALDPTTGEVLAMVGSRDFFDDALDGQFNVTLAPRQPGSSFKPIVYAEAFRQGLLPETVLYDAVTKFKTDIGKDYEPHNYDSKEHGLVSIRQALAGSLNIPAVKTLYLAGVDKVLDLAQQMGYTTLNDRSRFGLALVLGGAEVKLIEHVRAFAAFAQDGWQPALTTILSVEDAEGNSLQAAGLPDKRLVLEPNVARQITSILSDNDARAFIFGARNNLTLPDRPVAAKTGTTNDYHDAWTIGYTPSLVAGVWVGNNSNKSMKRGADGSVVAAPIWRDFLQGALKDTPVETFNPPEPKTVDKVMVGGTVSGTTVDIDLASGKLATDLTPPSQRTKRTFRQAHSILHYVKRGDLLGPAPERPEEDPNYASWEEAVKRWAKEHNVLDEQPPTEYDDLHVPANQPTLEVIEPAEGATLADRVISISLNVSAPRGIKVVQFFLDDRLLGQNTLWPYGISAAIPADVPTGPHTLRVTAYDDIDNSASVVRTVNVP